MMRDVVRSAQGGFQIGVEQYRNGGEAGEALLPRPDLAHAGASSPSTGSASAPPAALVFAVQA